jgi:hypothetical protein
MALLFELPICRQALEKKFFFAMWSSGRAAVVRRQFRPGIAGFRRGEGGGVAYGLLGYDLGARSVERSCRWAAHQTADGGGRRGCLFWRASGLGKQRAAGVGPGRVCGGEELTNFAGAARECKFAGAGTHGA